MNFDRIAPHYRWLETVFAGKTLQHCRTAWLEKVGNCREVLIIGEGDGRFLTEAGRALPQARFTCVDGSRKMLDLAAMRWRQAGFAAGRVTFVQAMLPDWQPQPGKYDLLVTHFFLDCLNREQIGPVIEKLAQAARPDARWLVSDFQIPAQGWPRLRARLIVSLAYTFFRLITGLPVRELVPPQPYLEANGFSRQERKVFEWGLLYAELWQRAGSCEETKCGKLEP